jgi:hypothetical protein
MNKNSFYTKILTDSEKRFSMGFDYSKNGLIDKFLSPVMYGNPRLSTFLKKLDSLFIELLESVKRIQFYTNYSIDKNDRRFNE